MALIIPTIIAKTPQETPAINKLLNEVTRNEKITREIARPK